MELDFVADLLARIPADPRLEVPPGDDAAVLRPPAERRTVVTVDMLSKLGAGTEVMFKLYRTSLSQLLSEQDPVGQVPVRAKLEF